MESLFLPPKRRTFSELYGVATQKFALFIVTAVKTQINIKFIDFKNENPNNRFFIPTESHEGGAIKYVQSW
jgi:hypothetical protein